MSEETDVEVLVAEILNGDAVGSTLGKIKSGVSGAKVSVEVVRVKRACDHRKASQINCLGEEKKKKKANRWHRRTRRKA